MRISQTIPRFMFQPGPPGCASARLDARPGSGLEERGNKGMGERGGRKEEMLWRRERESHPFRTGSRAEYAGETAP